MSSMCHLSSGRCQTSSKNHFTSEHHSSNLPYKRHNTVGRQLLDESFPCVTPPYIINLTKMVTFQLLLTTAIDLSCISRWCVRKMEPEQGWGAYFHKKHVTSIFFFILTSTWRHCSLECKKGLLNRSETFMFEFSWRELGKMEWMERMQQDV